MKLFKNLLPALGLVFGATLAMAMNFTDNPTERYAQDVDTEVWYDLTDIVPGSSTYNCDINPSITCSHEMPSISANQVESGEFVKKGSLPPAP
ncbi:DUF6520 family protein [Algoriphagus aquimarinus]|uniref:Uncharacterized protein n=1 Tax=Algoriphagus aquimarinus TaxID=237018 RepID=A0A5C7ACM0_9BACT|nr:DUF6520 family protein [Algoriphagus aquimarinus]TXE04749.1 hypothetical protein ESV85_18590 [Algoriphagus aquimarinus]